MLNEWPRLEPMDVICTDGGAGKISGAIDWAQGLASRNGARVTHALLYTGKSDVSGEFDIWESNFSGIWFKPLELYANTPCVVYRYRQMTDQHAANMLIRCDELERQGYGFTKIPLFLADAVGGFINRRILRRDTEYYWFTQNLGRVQHWKVCSQAVAYIYGKEFKHDVFYRPWQSVNPDTLDDICRQYPYIWTEIHNTLPANS